MAQTYKEAVQTYKEAVQTQQELAAELEGLLTDLVSAAPAARRGACARLAALAAGGIARAHAERFKRGGGVARLTALLRSADADLVDAAAGALARLSSADRAHGGATRAYAFDGGEGGAAVRVLVQQMDHGAAGTGYSVWTSALLLCRWLCSPGGLACSRVRERTVLELGAGCGAVGLAAAQLGAPSVVLSDNQPEVLRTLRATLALNRIEPPCRARVARVDWAAEVGDLEHVPELDPLVVLARADGPASADAEGGLGADERFDLILGSDVVYEASHPRLVAGLAARRLARGGLLVLAVAVRSLPVHAALLAALAAEPALGDVRVERLESEWGEFALPDLVESGTTMHGSHYPGGHCLVCVEAAAQLRVQPAE